MQLSSALYVYVNNKHTQYPHVGVAPIAAPTLLFVATAKPQFGFAFHDRAGVQPSKNAVVSFRNNSNWSWCTQWPALGTWTRRQLRMAFTRGSFSGTGAQLSRPQKSSVGAVI